VREMRNAYKVLVRNYREINYQLAGESKFNFFRISVDLLRKSHCPSVRPSVLLYACNKSGTFDELFNEM